MEQYYELLISWKMNYLILRTLTEFTLLLRLCSLNESPPRVVLFCDAFIKFAFAAEVSKVQRKLFGNIIDCERLDNKHIMEQRNNRKAEKRSS
jgi:hypothetical protein